MDDSVGRIVEQLRKSHMLENSIIIFSTDNGGPAEGFNSNFASNYPLRGVKNTLWEGGVRGAGLVWSAQLSKRPRVADQTMHIADWLPTLLEAAGGEAALAQLNNAQLDGMSVWQALLKNEVSPRKSVLHNIDDIWGSAALSVGDWKLVKGTNYNGSWDGWYGPAGTRNPRDYDWYLVVKSPAGQALQQLKVLPKTADMMRAREAANVICKDARLKDAPNISCNPLKAPCLFNIREDPCEQRNQADV